MNVKIFVVLLGTLTMAACVDTQVMPLSENTVRINTQAGGALFKGQAVPATMRTAAKETLARGFTHFKFYEAGLSQGSQFAGTVSSANGSMNANCSAYGNMGSCSGMYSGTGSTVAINRHVESSEATVVMYHANEPGAKGAFKAADILQQYPE